MTTDLETIAMLRDSMQRYSADHYDFLQRAKRLELPGGFDPAIWQTYAEQGWLSLRLPEELGGLGGDAVAVGAVMEVVGSRLLMEPLLGSALLAPGALLRQGSAGQQAELLGAVTEGRLQLALADAGYGAPLCRYADGRLTGEIALVLNGDSADQFIVPALDERQQLLFCLLDAAAAERRAFRLVDGRGAATLRLQGAPATVLQAEPGAPTAEQALAELRDEAAVALCAEALGVAESLLRITNDYLKVRQQFGKPLAANQALQHRMADVYLLVAEIRALTRAMEQAMAQPLAERASLISGGRAYVIRAARDVANEAIQMHGGVGVTEELEVSHYFRRLMVNAALYGSHDTHFARFLEQSLPE